MRPSILPLALLALLAALPATAAADVPFEITPHVGYRMGGEFDGA